MRTLEIALPAPGGRLEQDQEWVVARTDGGWERIRLHDYARVFAVPGLYERWVYDVLQCRSPAVIRRLLERSLMSAGMAAGDLVVLDLGAGNGCGAEELAEAGARRFVGVDIHPEARHAADRDRPGLYADYVVGDLTDLHPEGRATLGRHAFNCLTCVAALGFGDIPVPVFAAAYDRIAVGGFIAFTIKTDFLEESDDSGFSRLVRRMMSEGVMELEAREDYQHRLSTDGRPLMYTAFVGRTRGSIPPSLLEGLG